MSDQKPIITKEGIELIPVENNFSDDQIKQMNKELNSYNASIIQEEIMKNINCDNIKDIPVRNSNEKTEQLLEENNQTNHSIHYENMKTNAQLNTLLKVIDSQNDELKSLQSVNQELQKMNNVLEKKNEQSTRNTVLWSMITGIILLGIEHWKDIYNFILSLIK